MNIEMQLEKLSTLVFEQTWREEELFFAQAAAFYKDIEKTEGGKDHQTW